jgi:hypothetical protein
VLVAHETNRIRTGRLRLLKLWKRREQKALKLRCKRAQKEKIGPSILGISSPAEKGSYNA